MIATKLWILETPEGIEYSRYERTDVEFVEGDAYPWKEFVLIEVSS